jgi:hypothetical protein
MSDHGDHAVAAHDLTDLYVFRKPGDPAKTILAMGMNPDVVPGVPPPRARPFDPDARYDFMIDADGDAVPDSAFRITFSTDGAGRQTGTVRRLAGGDAASSSADGPAVLRDAPVSPAAEPLITVEGGIAFFAGRRSDPFFEDFIGNGRGHSTLVVPASGRTSSSSVGLSSSSVGLVSGGKSVPFGVSDGGARGQPCSGILSPLPVP